MVDLKVQREMPGNLVLKVSRDSLRKFWEEGVKDTKRNRKSAGKTSSRLYGDRDGQIIDLFEIQKVCSRISIEDFQKHFIIYDRLREEEMEKGGILSQLPLSMFREFYPDGIYNGLIHSHPEYEDPSIRTWHTVEDVSSLYSLSKRLSKAKNVKNYFLTSIILPISADIELITSVFKYRILLPNIKRWKLLEDLLEDFGTMSRIYWEVHDPFNLHKNIESRLKRSVSTDNKIEALRTFNDLWRIYKKYDIVSKDKIPGHYQGVLLDWLSKNELFWHIAENDLFDDCSSWQRSRAMDPIVFQYDENETIGIARPVLKTHGRTFNYPDILEIKTKYGSLVGEYSSKLAIYKEYDYESRKLKPIFLGAYAKNEKQIGSELDSFGIYMSLKL